MSDNNQRENVSGEETPKTFSKDELLAEIAQMISKQSNAAITQRLSSFEAKMDAAFAKMSSPVIEEAPSTSKTKSKDKDPEFLAMQKKIEAMEAKEAKIVAEQRDGNLRKSLSEILAKGGVDQKSMKAALAVLVDSDKVVGYTADEFAQNKDAMIWRSKDGEMDLTKGAADWLRSDEGKTFVAPKGAQGAGDKSYSAAKQPANGAMSDSALASLLTNLRNG